MKPMTFSFTFDDGLKSHYRVAAPLLERYGWHGVFSVPTGIVTVGRANAVQAKDMCIVGNEDNVMSWDDVCDLIARGHVCCPHTVSHADLAEMEARRDADGLSREICGARDEFASRTGAMPKFFCLPHCSGSGEVAALVRRFGMEPINGTGRWRVNFGEYSPDGNSYSDITAFLRRFYYLGFPHVDIMVHGIDRATGGWRPFADAGAFASFLENVRAEEMAGRVQVVDYTAARHNAIQPWDRKLYFGLYRRLFKIRVPELC